ncbi:hypothetical protein [uncultured Slackia sp.]|uniref:hypothetical protein n=1 Tax=uncultured Slackia sp. TaxID=665903 RepID=UPI0026E025ED|nr:hypothetical protein [uncultured Slackia sp.]
MEQHPTAKLTPKGRETLVSRIRSGLGVAEAVRRRGSARGAGASCLRVAVDDFSRVAYAELLPDERKGPARRSWAVACASSRAWACGSSA